ncbi:OmpA family protein [Thauera sinica]|uniref:OmpA family protein n=1 Tax=Thauera sinica TaxID=2665146 RepID=A0ABW1AY80_9RHOO|nr:OmpA family protein [Thauera sp. K11]ATE59080.1 flagellar motor protein MotB [Thauera sp. K11]
MKIQTSLLPVLLAALLAACATPPRPGAGTAPIHDGNSARMPAPDPAPDWTSLRAKLAGALRSVPGIEIGDASADGLRLQIPVSDGFASGRTELRPPLMRALDALAPALAAEPDVAIQVVGHTDSQGSEMYNLQLSIARAEAVAEYLRSRGIGLARLSADGRGEADPLTSNAQESGRARNRRVEIILRPMP